MSAVSRMRIDGLLPWSTARGTDPCSPCQTLAATIPTAAAWNAAAIAFRARADVRAEETDQGPATTRAMQPMVVATTAADESQRGI